MSTQIDSFNNFWESRSAASQQVAHAMSGVEVWAIDDAVIESVEKLANAIRHGGQLTDLDHGDCLKVLAYLTTINAIPLMEQLQNSGGTLIESLVEFAAKHPDEAERELLVHRLQVMRRAEVINDIFSPLRFERLGSYLRG